jgi:predicted alpha/beta hydrolase
MTVSSTVEMRLRGREPSTVPAQAAGRILGVAPTGEHERRRIATFVHWGYGAGWGAARGLIGALGVRGSGATALFFAVVWCAELVTLPALDIGVAPVWRWSRVEVGIDAFHHAVYVISTSLAYECLDRRHG